MSVLWVLSFCFKTHPLWLNFFMVYVNEKHQQLSLMLQNTATILALFGSSTESLLFFYMSLQSATIHTKHFIKLAQSVSKHGWLKTDVLLEQLEQTWIAIVGYYHTLLQGVSRVRQGVCITHWPPVCTKWSLNHSHIAAVDGPAVKVKLSG